MMKRLILILCLICLFIIGLSEAYLIYSNKEFSKEKIEALFNPITSKYGIKIVYEVGDDFLSDLVNPPIAAGPARGSKVTPIKHRILARFPEILEKALKKYPDQVIKENIKAIHFAGEIDQNGFKAGGSYDPFKKVLFLVSNGRQKDKTLICVFHHEFSSLLLKSHSFFVNPWIDNNPRDFEYLYDISSDTLETFKNASLSGTADDYAKGFLNTYGQTNFENDFNEYSAMIFTYPKKFKKIMNQYPIVRAKFRVWLEFYQKVDPIFTEAYLLGEG